MKTIGLMGLMGVMLVGCAEKEVQRRRFVLKDSSSERDYDVRPAREVAGPDRVTSDGASAGPSMPYGMTARVINPATQPGGSRYVNPERQQVGGYQRSDGGWVGSYERTRANSTTQDNLRP